MRSATMGFAVLAVTCVLFAAVVIAQQAPMPARDTLPDGPRMLRIEPVRTATAAGR